MSEKSYAADKNSGAKYFSVSIVNYILLYIIIIKINIEATNFIKIFILHWQNAFGI